MLFRSGMANPLLHNGLPPFTLHANAVFPGNGSNDRLPLPNFRSADGRSRFWIIEVGLIVAGSLAFCSAVPPAAGAGLGRSIDMIFASRVFKSIQASTSTTNTRQIRHTCEGSFRVRAC